MSSRFLQRDYFVCGLCNSVQRHIRGYKPIPNPILFNSAEQCKAFARDQKDCVGYVDSHVMKKCDCCKSLHGSWRWVDFQEALRRKDAKHALRGASEPKQQELTK